MISLYYVIAFSILIAGIFLGFFIWAIRSDQWRDLETPSQRLLTEELDEK